MVSLLVIDGAIYHLEPEKSQEKRTQDHQGQKSLYFKLLLHIS